MEYYSNDRNSSFGGHFHRYHPLDCEVTTLGIYFCV